MLYLNMSNKKLKIDGYLKENKFLYYNIFYIIFYIIFNIIKKITSERYEFFIFNQP